MPRDRRLPGSPLPPIVNWQIDRRRAQVLRTAVFLRMAIFRAPLLRLLAINLAAGTAAAVLLLCGLLALNPHGLRDLISRTARPPPRSGCCCSGCSSPSAARRWAPPSWRSAASPTAARAVAEVAGAVDGDATRRTTTSPCRCACGRDRPGARKDLVDRCGLLFLPPPLRGRVGGGVSAPQA